MAANSVRCPPDRGESVKGGSGHAPLSQKDSSNRESRRDLRFPARSAGGSADGALDYIEPRRRNALRNKRPRQRTPWSSGGGGIRTHGTVAGTPAFRAGQFSHSCTPPGSRGTWNSIQQPRDGQCAGPIWVPLTVAKSGITEAPAPAALQQLCEKPPDPAPDLPSLITDPRQRARRTDGALCQRGAMYYALRNTY